MKIDELFIALGVVADEKKARDFFNVLDTGRQIMLGLAATAVGTTLSIGAMFDKTMTAAVALSNFSAATGLSSQELQRWQHAGESMGLSVDEVTSSIAALNRELEIEKRTGGGALSSALGQILPGKTILDFKNAFELLEGLREGIPGKGIPAQTLSNLLVQAGLSENMGKLIRMNRGQFAGAANAGTVFSDRDIAVMTRANAALKNLGQTISYIFGKALIDVTPVLTDLVGSLKKWSDQNSGELQSGIKQVVEMVVSMGKEIKGAFELIDRIIKGTIGWKNAVLLLVAAFAMLNPVYGILILIVDALNLINNLITGTGSWQEKLSDFLEGKSGLISSFTNFGIKIAKAVAEGIKTGLKEWFGGIRLGSLEEKARSILAENKKKSDRDSWGPTLRALGAIGEFFTKGRESSMLGKYVEAGVLKPTMGWQGGSGNQGINTVVNQTIHTTADGSELMKMATREAMRVWASEINISSLQTAGGY